MVHICALFAASIVLSSVSAAPLDKRITQTIADSTTAWEAACIKAGGADKCNPISQTAFTSLLAAGKNCDQQDAGDQMVTLAKTLNNDPEMIRLAQLFVQQPRNAPNSLQVPYCQTAPQNAELNGFFHCQFSSSDFTKFSGDQTGNLPLGVTAVSPPGSCPAKTDGPVPDGVQLNTLVQSPGTPEGGAADVSVPVSDTKASSTNKSTNNASIVRRSQPFTLQNGLDAIAQNTKFASLTATSPCTEGQEACVGGEFAQCVGGSFATTQCAGGTQCFVLPLVDKAGTSIACTTQADFNARIAATGA